MFLATSGTWGLFFDILSLEDGELCSFLELYNEETTDLLAVGDRQDQKLRIMEDRSGVVIQVCHQNCQTHAAFCP